LAGHQAAKGNIRPNLPRKNGGKEAHFFSAFLWLNRKRCKDGEIFFTTNLLYAYHIINNYYNHLFSHAIIARDAFFRSEEHTSELQSRFDLVCRLLLEKKTTIIT